MNAGSGVIATDRLKPCNRHAPSSLSPASRVDAGLAYVGLRGEAVSVALQDRGATYTQIRPGITRHLADSRRVMRTPRAASRNRPQGVAFERSGHTRRRLLYPNVAEVIARISTALTSIRSLLRSRHRAVWQAIGKLWEPAQCRSSLA